MQNKFKEGMAINREEFKKLNPVGSYKKQKVKNVSLLSGKLEGFRWEVKLRIKGNAIFNTLGLISIQNEKVQNKTYYGSHKGERMQKSAEWRKKNPEKSQQISMKSQKKHPEVRRKNNTKSHVKRKKHLGFEPINEPFEGAHAHHMTKDVVIYIPAELHRSIRHNVFTGEGMKEINEKALNWLKKVKKQI